MARTTMSWLIDRVRQLLNDTDDALFTDDDDIQAVLDEDGYRVRRHQLRADATKKMFTSEYRDLEGVVDDDTGSWTGANRIAIYASGSSGASELTPDAWNLRAGVFEFDDAQTDVYYNLDCWVFDPYLAAAKLCEQLTLKSTITPGGGETGGALVGRYDYGAAALRFRRYAKPTRIELRRVRSKRRAR